jgi:methylthioxylose transferase
MSDRGLWLTFGLGAAVALFACYEVATLSLVLGTPAGGWYYGYLEDLSIRPVGAALLVVGTAGALLFFLPPRQPRHDWLIVLAWVVAATGLQALLRSLTPFSLEDIFRSDAANSFYSVTLKFDARRVLEDFEQIRSQWPLHAQSNMPGKLILLYGLETMTPRTDALPWLIVIVSNLGAFLMYGFVRDLFRDRRVALYSAALYLFVPARLLFFPLMNTVTPVVTLVSACILVRWLATGKAAYAALLGVSLYALVFFEPLPLAMGLLFAALLGRAILVNGMTARQMAAHVAVGGVGFAVTAFAMRLWFGFDLLSAFQHVKAHAVEFNAAQGRPYALWLWHNLREFAFGTGLCQIVLFWAALADGLRTPGPWRTRLTKPVTVVCLGLLAVLMAIDLIGVNRGEVTRLWIFLACFFQIPAAYVCARVQSPIAVILVIGLSSLQAALGTAMIAFVSPR